MKAYIAKDEEIVRDYDQKGVAKVELLPGSFDGPLKAYKYFLKAGSDVSMEKYADKAVVFIFGKGKGYIADTAGGFKIDDLCFYAPNFDKGDYVIHAIEDLEFVMCVSEMDDYDRFRAGECRVHLPFFRTVNQCYRYEQDCKTPGMQSRSILFGDFGRLGKITMGLCRGTNAGTVEKAHNEVHQWNYCVGNSDFEMTVEDEKYNHKAGDWSFIPAGYDHSLVAGPGKEVYYVWVELYTSQKGVY
ncbi:cupin domain-containing protein [Youxingia wuxianensis]|uniref:Cupin domain-containing protein n=1 Tax=Youxingia wuxianensis TaxID=2763678 RepID=A0A926IHP6_9FIRM|nr:cupin domain-containing protein [Youxingia wuxianensis]MBC8585511.1 cupin domain-containing protein [Youxingia wuxianensis]